jgi:glutamine phosphoribosylpyrophosphate amidotransferase
MCGIAGFSLAADAAVEPTLLARALLTGIAERGRHASGIAYRTADGAVEIEKRRSGASRLLRALALPAGTAAALLHVRDYTKGHPSLDANNHPIRHGAVVGIHNGQLENDEELFASFGIPRAEPGMTVDSEAIFALVHRLGAPAALEEVRGTMACAWLDEREAELVSLARGRVRPLVVAEGDGLVAFASTEAALRLAASVCSLELDRTRELAEGEHMAVRHGRMEAVCRFTPPLLQGEAGAPTDPSPAERERCLTLLEQLAAAA